MANINTLLTGATGLTAVTLTPELIPQTADTAGITQTLIQIIIGIVTLFGLLKKKKSI